MPRLDANKSLEMLGLTAQAGDAEIRSAYLEQVRRHPPDRDPERFEQIRDAYECLRNPATRALSVLEGPDPMTPLASLVQQTGPKRCFVGSQLWMNVLKEKRK